MMVIRSDKVVCINQPCVLGLCTLHCLMTAADLVLGQPTRPDEDCEGISCVCPGGRLRLSLKGV